MSAEVVANTEQVPRREVVRMGSLGDGGEARDRGIT